MSSQGLVNVPLQLPELSFASPLTDVVMELEHLRRLTLSGDTPPLVFFQLKRIFHLLESLGSARIEGNRTTLADYIEAKVGNEPVHGENIREIENIEQAMDYLETAVTKGSEITHLLIRELHSLTVKDLVREGDRTPGRYRTGPVMIAGATHTPPAPLMVQDYMQELVAFINRNDPPKYDLLKAALAHHRFAWVHPFSNGNGRVVRLLTYALLIKYGFNVTTGGRVLNPTAVFCNDRQMYYDMLSLADSGTPEGTEQWCLYVLSGIRDELAKVDQLTRYEFLKDKILFPALEYSRTRGLILPYEEKVLRQSVTLREFKSSDYADLFPEVTERQRAYQLKKLVDSGMLQPVRPGARTYSINFVNNALIRGVMRVLVKEGFAPPYDEVQ
ncbi:Fic family protein [Geomonas silvestris]|uniref:Fic family protein n=1 Tax=Geomonas silvestris TaxID=2740184 RepID=A0A6V8MLL9_9BACT|nr:Fic family protein [Geomonas silvestris]GFO60941.1 Fic family protein [Geomonas silvestris]